MTKNDDFYITTLKYGRNALPNSKGVNHNEVRDHVKRIHPNINDEVFLRMFFSEFQALQDMGKGHVHHIENDTPHVLNIEAYFRLLEHEELEEARTSSKRALFVATGAIAISIFTAAASIWIQLKIPAIITLT